MARYKLNKQRPGGTVGPFSCKRLVKSSRGVILTDKSETQFNRVAINSHA